MVPTLMSFALLVNPTNRTIAETTTNEVLAAARTLGLQAHIVPTSNSGEIDAAFGTLNHQEVRALMTMSAATSAMMVAIGGQADEEWTPFKCRD